MTNWVSFRRRLASQASAVTKPSPAPNIISCGPTWIAEYHSPLPAELNHALRHGFYLFGFNVNPFFKNSC